MQTFKGYCALKFTTDPNSDLPSKGWVTLDTFELDSGFRATLFGLPESKEAVEFMTLEAKLRKAELDLAAANRLLDENQKRLDAMKEKVEGTP